MKEKLTSITCHDSKCCNNSRGKCMANSIIVGAKGKCKSFTDVRSVMFNNGIDTSYQPVKYKGVDI